MTQAGCGVAGTAGIKFGSPVAYMPTVSMMGGTPAFGRCMLLFRESVRAWEAVAQSVGDRGGGAGGSAAAESAAKTGTARGAALRAFTWYKHHHVLQLHRQFLALLKNSKSRLVNEATLVPPSPPLVRSHTLVFQVPTYADAKVVVDRFKAAGVDVDARKTFVRVGFGLSHTAQDVTRLAEAASSI